MANSELRVTLRRVGACGFEAKNRDGSRTRLDGSPDLAAKILERVDDPEALPKAQWGEATTTGLRPMEMMLVSLAACSAMDVALILTRQREKLGELHIEVTGQRADATPAVFEHILMHFRTNAEVDAKKLERAVALSVKEYCSVARMLRDDVVIEVLATSDLSHSPT